MIDPLALNGVSLVDALVYSATLDTSAQSATLTLEVEPSFHDRIRDLVDTALDDDAMIDLVLRGVHSLRVRGITKRSTQWADDEKPHDYEIATVSVRKQTLRRGYELRIQCQLGQVIDVVFEEIVVQRSMRKPGQTHEYLTKAKGN